MKTYRKIVSLLLVASLVAAGALAVACSDDDDDDSDDLPPGDDDDDDDSGGSLSVGASQVEITPDWPVVLGGYGMFFLSDRFCRWSEGVHDPLYATAVAIEDAHGDAIIQIALDAIGILEDDTHAIQNGIAQATGVLPEHILVSASHSHASPDTVGIYGVMFPPQTGRDEQFVARMIDGAIDAGVSAWVTRVPATARAAEGWVPDYHFNHQAEKDPDATLDSTMAVLGFYDEAGEPIATVMNWGSHPTVLPPENVMISSDYVGGYFAAMDARIGGVHQFLNGNMGASVRARNAHALYGEDNEEGWGDFDDAWGVGEGLAESTLELLDGAVTLDDPDLSIATGVIVASLDNPLLRLMSDLGVIAHDVPAEGEDYAVEMLAYRLGPVVVATAPGEVVPNVGFELRDIMDGDVEMIVNVAQDWVGYIMTAEQYRNLRYIDYSFVCTGPGVGEAIKATYNGVFGPGGSLP